MTDRLGDLVRLDNPEITIQGTSETVLATANCNAWVDDAGVGRWDFIGSTEVFWDTQVTQKRGEEILFLDENGEDVPISNVGVKLDDDTVVPLRKEQAG